MTQAQIYCTLNQLVSDLLLQGSENSIDTNLMDKIEAASEVIRKKAGNFIPITETRKFGVNWRYRSGPLYIPPVLSVTTMINDGTTLQAADYLLRPINRMWENGPYISIETDYLWGDEDDIEITGKWGLYEETRSLGINATQATASDTSLVVTDGSKICAGMVLLIESEQEYVEAGAGGAGSPAATVATSKLNGAVDQHDTEITVDNGAEFYAGEVLQIGVEDLRIIKKNGHVLGVERGWNGTVPADHIDDSAIGVYRIFTVVRGVNGTTAAVHTSKVVNQCMVPETVNYLCRQIAALMVMKAKSGFSGLTGNSEMGQGKFYSEFPPSQIATVLNPFNVGE